MDERVVQFRIGVMVLSTLLVAGILVAMFGSEKWRRGYTVYILLPEAPGVREDSPIRKSGVLVGRVAGLDLRADGKVMIKATIFPQYLGKLRHNEVCWVSPTLLGDATMEFVLSKDPTLRPTPVRDGDVMRGAVAPNPLREYENMRDDLWRTMGTVAKTSEDAGQLVRQLNEMLQANEHRIQSIVVKTDQTLDGMQQALGRANQMMGDPQMQARIRETVEQIPGLVSDMRTIMESMNETIRLANQNLDNVQGFTQPLAEHGESMIARLDQSTEKLNALLDEMVTFAQALKSPDSTMGQLLRDKTLYERTQRTVANIEDLTQQMKPILQDARVFSDKIARHPELLGVRGAISGSTGTKGVPQISWPPREYGSGVQER